MLRRLCIIQVSWKVLGKFSATFAGSLLTNVSASKDLIFRGISKILFCMIVIRCMPTEEHSRTSQNVSE